MRKISEARVPDQWLLTVQEPQDGIPGYLQVDAMDDQGNNLESMEVEDLRARGYELPDLTGLRQGQYQFSELYRRSRDIIEQVLTRL